MRHSPKQFSLLATPLNFTRRLITGLLLLNILVLGLAIFTIHEDRLEHERRAGTAAQNFSQLLANDLAAVFGRSDLVLHTIVADIEKHLVAGAIHRTQLNEFLKLQQSYLPEIASLRVADEKGLVRYGEGLPPGAPVDISDREYFILQKGNANAGLVIAKPVKSRISNEWVIPISRRINRPDGNFSGIVYINIPVTHFTQKFGKLDLGPYGLVAMRSSDHMSIARFPEMLEGGGAIGQFALSDQLRNLLKDNPESVTYIAPSPVDHIERIFSYRKLQQYPLYVVTGLALQDIRAEWWRDTAQTIAVVALFTLSTILFAWLLIRSWRRQLATSEALRENEQRWSFALESGDFAVWDWDIPQGKVLLSKLGKQLFGYGDKEIGDHMIEWAARCHPDDVSLVESRIKNHFRKRTENFSAEFRVRCKNGDWKWILSRGLVVKRAADGKPLRMIGLHSDISERKHNEESMRLSSTVFNIADEAMLVTDPHNNILSVNPAFTAITGYTPEEVVGQNPKLLSAKTHTKEFYRELWSSLLNTGSWSGEMLNRKKDGTSYVEWLTIKRVLNEKGELTHHVAVFSDITARKASEERMRYLALHDALTDLPNRLLLSERIKQAIIRARREKLCMSLLYFDLDKFKPVNDTHGHEVGDWLLKSVAERVVACVRESDTVSRIGGDEFVVLLPRLEKDMDVLAVAEKIRAALNQPFSFAELSFEISTSIGAAIYPEHGDNEITLMRNADIAMYHAKKNGRNQVTLYREGMHQD